MSRDPVIDPPVREADQAEPAEPEPQELDGPDPRTWQGNPGIWDLVEDIRVIDEVLAVMNGPVAQDGMSPVYEAARRFLRQAGAQTRERLAAVLLATYGAKLSEIPAESPFSHAGRPRAFGAEPPPSPGNV